MPISLPSYDEQRVREELDLAARAANSPAARSHNELARLYLRRIAQAKAVVRPVN